jgi:hypothetical protein
VTQIVPVFLAPDLDNAWSVAPGALSVVTNFAPMQLGSYGSVGPVNYITGMTGTDVVSAYMFRQIDGTVRYLVNRATDLDEYNSSGTRFNRATGLTSATDWSMCAAGNAIIACSAANATQVSTGTTFAALGGSSPKAVHCASNMGFVMLANTDSSTDQVAWSALYNYASFVPSIATEAGNTRLLEAPGPITALVTFKDGFVAFKDNALFIGEYVGPNYLWRWRMLSNRIGCVGGKAVAELDGKLYFMHTSGFYEFDGQTIRNVGLPVNQTVLSAALYVTIPGRQTTAANIYDGLQYTQACADDIEGVVWFRVTTYYVSTSKYSVLFWCYNPRSQKWGTYNGTGATDNDTRPAMVQASSADIQKFLAVTTARFLYVQNVSGTITTKAGCYPYATGTASSVITGVIGSTDGATTLMRAHWRTLAGSDAWTGVTITATGYNNENKNITNGTTTGTLNTEWDYGDVRLASRFRTLTLTQATGTKSILAGLGIDVQPQGKR